MSVSVEMKNHLQSGLTHLAVFLTIISKDGEVLRVWNGTRNKIVDGETFYAFPVAPSRLQQKNGLQADNFEITATYTGLFNSATLRSKKWMGAKVVYEVRDYKMPWLGYAERRVAYLGQTETGKFAAKPELKSLGAKLSQPVGQTCQALCDVEELGDLRCGVDLEGETETGYKIKTRAHVTAVSNRQQFTIAFDEPIKPAEPLVSLAPDDLFERGKITFLTDNNAGAEMMILTNAGNGLTLYLPMFYNIAIGTEIRITTGCNRKITVCRDVYGNAARNRSVYMLPGRSKVLKFD